MMDKIAKAFVKAQKEFGPALKTATNPHFRSKYADLSACIEAVIDALNNNGIALMQLTHECENGVIIETVFLHESGETLSSGKLHVPASKFDAQGYGSSLTYCRRYSLMAACGIAPEDDDGNAATKAPPSKTGTTRHANPGNGDGLEEKAKLKVMQAVGEVQSLMKQDKEFEAYEAKQAAELDADETVYFWSHFDSKQRSALKSIHDSLQKTYGAQNLDA